MSLLNKKPKDKLTSRLTGLLQPKPEQPLVPRICPECYELLEKHITDLGVHNMISAHCPHHSVLIDVLLIEGVPQCVQMTGPITWEDAKAMLKSERSSPLSGLQNPNPH
jgi:hypothetical protein